MGKREDILDEIKRGLRTASFDNAKIVDFQSPVFRNPSESLEIEFVQELQKVNGKFVFCMNEVELVQNLHVLIEKEEWDSISCIDPFLQDFLKEADIPFDSGEDSFNEMKAGITRCEILVARSGSIVVSPNHSGRRMNVFPPVHIVVAFTSQLVYSLKEAFEIIQKKYDGEMPSSLTVITGPSRTADIEKNLVLGAHGPKELYVFLVIDNHEEQA